MKWNDIMDQRSKANLLTLALGGSAIVVVYMFFSNFSFFQAIFDVFLGALSPFIFGVVFAFLLVPFRKLVENHWLKKSDLSPKAKRGVAVFASILLMIAILITFFAILIPQLFSSIQTFMKSFGDYVNNLEELLGSLTRTSTTDEVTTFINSILDNIVNSAQSWLTSAAGGITKILSAGVSMVSSVMNFMIGIVVAVYLLYDEEKFKKTAKKLLYGIFPKKQADWLRYFYNLNKEAFNGFVFGKLIDSLIIGVLCYIVIAFMKLPYPELIAVIIGVTNVIPVFGPFIGAIPCLIILVLINPWAAFKFLIFIIILQQIDGNIIGPKILGDSLGLPTLWIMFAIIVGGAMFGILGMIIGVPMFSVFYTLVKDWINSQLKKKEIKIE